MTLRESMISAQFEALKQKAGAPANEKPAFERRIIALRGALGAIQKAETAGRRHDLTEEEVVRVIKSEVETREKSAAIYDEAGAPARAADERLEADTLREFLPREASSAELKDVIASVIVAQNLEGQGKRAIGTVMKELKSRFSNFDSRIASQITMELV